MHGVWMKSYVLAVLSRYLCIGRNRNRFGLPARGWGSWMLLALLVALYGTEDPYKLQGYIETRA